MVSDAAPVLARLREQDDLAFEVNLLDPTTELELGVRLDVRAVVVFPPRPDAGRRSEAAPTSRPISSNVIETGRGAVLRWRLRGSCRPWPTPSRENPWACPGSVDGHG